MQPRIYKTTSRKLEEFLFVHDIHWSSTYRNHEGRLVWVYLLTSAAEQVIQEYRQIIANRNQRRG